jgi:hypothetical protein
LALHENSGGIVKFMHHIIYAGTKADVEISAPDENFCACQKIRRPSKDPNRCNYWKRCAPIQF